MLLDPLFKMIHPESVLPKSLFKASPSGREHWKKTQKISR